jgi:hypothetical protein
MKCWKPTILCGLDVNGKSEQYELFIEKSSLRLNDRILPGRNETFRRTTLLKIGNFRAIVVGQ